MCVCVCVCVCVWGGGGGGGGMEREGKKSDGNLHSNSSLLIKMHQITQ